MRAHNFALLTKAVIWEDTDVTFLARLMGDSSNNLAALVQADVASVAYKVFDQAAQVSTTGSLTVSDVILNSLNTGTIWTADDTGFNFKATIAASYFPAGDQTYTVEFKFTLAGGSVFFACFEVTTAAVRSS